MEELDSSQRLQLDVLEEEYRRRHGVAVEWIKAAVGDGETFENEVGRVVISDNGAWFECTDLPMEFSGSAGGPCEHRFLSDEEMMSLAESLHAVSESDIENGVREFSLLALYARSGIVDELAAFVFQTRRGPHGETIRPIRAGEWRFGTAPRLFRSRIIADKPLQSLPIARGTLVCLSGIGERNLLVLMPRESEDVRDLGSVSASPLPH